MATVNSLLFLLTTLAPNVERSENSSVAFQPSSEWNSTEFFWNHRSVSQSKCPENEEYNECGTPCPKDCAHYGKHIPCTHDCVAGCFCKEPMIRGFDGKCVYEDTCPNVLQIKEHASLFPDKECPINEIYTCEGHCQRDCETPPWEKCPGCVPGCVCIWPQVRGPRGQCIPLEWCSNDHLLTVTARSTNSEGECNKDEEMSCYSHCEKNCTNYDQDTKCPIYCVNGCVCKEPKIRGPDGTCILPQECPSSQRWTPKIPIPHICGADERFSACQAHCQKNCSNFDQEISCPIICLPGCVCREPMIRGPNGACILPEQCFASPTDDSCPDSEGCTTISNDFETSSSPALPENSEECGENEFYHLCGSSCQADCSNPQIMYESCPDKRCVAGCFCKLGYFRHGDGRCVNFLECLQIPLPRYTIPSPKSQIWGTNYLRTIDGVPSGVQKLVPPVTFIKTRTCSDDEEYNECGASCQKTCSNYNDVTPCPEQCVPGCACKAPMIRGPDGNCIHEQECPDRMSKALKPNFSGACPFAHMDFRYDCGLIEEFSCVTKREPKLRMCFVGCLCIRPRVRNYNQCVLPEECPARLAAGNAMELPDFSKLPDLPKLKCKENEEFSLCASICPDSCTNYNQTDRVCKRICIPGCRCKQGYVIGDDGICINKKACKESGSSAEKHDECGEHEYYDECGSACETDCDTPEKNCENEGCKKGCFCKPEYVRSAEKKCILPSECPVQSAPTKSFWDF